MARGYRNMALSKYLSKAAQSGRHGDDILVHMNKDEAKTLAASVGLEELPTNPTTGLPEAWAWEAATLAFMVGGSLIKGYQARQSADTQIDLVGEQQKALDKSQVKLGEAKSTKIAAVQQDATTQLNQQSDKTGIAKEDLLTGYEKALEKSGGLAVSGDVEEKKSESWKRISSAFEHTKENLIAGLGKAYGDIEGWFEGEVGRIDAERVALDFKKKQYEQQQNIWFG